MTTNWDIYFLLYHMKRGSVILRESDLIRAADITLREKPRDMAFIKVLGKMPDGNQHWLITDLQDGRLLLKPGRVEDFTGVI